MPAPAPRPFAPPQPRTEPTERWVRVRLGDTEIANSRRAILLIWYGPGMLPTYCIPSADVATELLRPSKTQSDQSFIVKHDVRTADSSFDGGAQRFRDPPPPFDRLHDHWTFAWDSDLQWFEEAVEIHVHARDPSKRVDAVPSERHIRVELDGELLADSHRPTALFETTLPTRWYLPREDVRHELLIPSDTVTRCPYKGVARYWSVRTGKTLHPDIAWGYPDPIPECPGVKDLICFFNEHVDLTVDGVRVDRPKSPWST